MKIIDDYLPQEQVNVLDNLTIEYAKVHWVGAKSESVNPLTDLVHSTYQYLATPALGATAWYNVRPIDPTWHSDILSYNNSYPKDELIPESTFLYYMREPDSGGNLELGDSDWRITRSWPVKKNRLMYFDAVLTHRVQPYRGNRVSIGMVWWKVTPDRYEEQSIDSYNVLERVWK